MNKHKDTKTQRYKDTKIQRQKDTKTKRHKELKIDKERREGRKRGGGTASKARVHNPHTIAVVSKNSTVHAISAIFTGSSI